MAERGSKSAQARAQAQRARLHSARKAWHQSRITRRVRDNTIAVIVGGIIIVAALASQVVHAQVTAPEPSPTSTSTVTPTSTATPSDLPTPESTTAQ